MNTTTRHDDPNRGDLLAWHVEPPAEPAFRAAVWARIDVRRNESALRWPGYWRRHALGWSLACALILTASALWGHAAGLRHKQAERSAVLQTYLAAIDSAAMNR